MGSFHQGGDGVSLHLDNSRWSRGKEQKGDDPIRGCCRNLGKKCSLHLILETENQIDLGNVAEAILTKFRGRLDASRGREESKMTSRVLAGVSQGRWRDHLVRWRREVKQAWELSLRTLVWIC